jgi:DNA polymerase-3 subunit delta'
MKPLPWHQSAIVEIESMRTADRLPHAMLIRGHDGWGESEFGNWLALTLLGESVERDAREFAHPDLLWVQPEGAEVKTDAIRYLIEFAQRTRLVAECKVAVVEQAHLLNINAANALLKILEEPPADTYIVLTSCRPGRLIPTIRSRCQAIALRPDTIQARQWLQQHWDGKELEEKMFEYGDAPMLVASALAEEEPSLRPLLNELANSPHPTTHVPGLLDMNRDRLMSRWYRYCIALLADSSSIPALVGVAPREVCGFVDDLQSVRRQVAFSNSANAKVLLERLVVRWRGLRKTVPS